MGDFENKDNSKEQQEKDQREKADKTFEKDGLGKDTINRASKEGDKTQEDLQSQFGPVPPDKKDSFDADCKQAKADFQKELERIGSIPGLTNEEREKQMKEAMEVLQDTISKVYTDAMKEVLKWAEQQERLKDGVQKLKEERKSQNWVEDMRKAETQRLQAEQDAMKKAREALAQIENTHTQSQEKTAKAADKTMWEKQKDWPA